MLGSESRVHQARVRHALSPSIMITMMRERALYRDEAQHGRVLLFGAGRDSHADAVLQGAM